MDTGHRQTDELLDELEKRLAQEYLQAVKEVSEKLNDYLRRFAIKDELRRAMVEKGQMTAEDYKQWRIGQIMMGRRWQEMRDTLAEDYHHTNEIANSAIRGHCADVYALNHDFGTFEVERATGIDTSYTLYNRHAVEWMLRENPDILPPPGKRVSARIAAGLDERWNREKVQSVMLQSILQGESIAKIANRLADAVGESNHKAAIRNARTMTTGAENAGRVASYKRAEELGINVLQQWTAVHDEYTRESHRLIDGETAKVGEMFSNGCRFPGDPGGEPAEVYNCRCTLNAYFPKYDKPGIHKAGMTDEEYEEWRNSKPQRRSITQQEEKGEAIKNSYIREYRRAMG